MSGFKDVVGHRDIIQYIQNAVEQDKVSHAYILNGAKGAGKKMLAKLFAMTLQCENSQSDPCGECRSCKQADSGNQPDIITIQHEKPGSISVDDIREQLNGDIMIKPYSSRYKIYIIPEADLLTVQAQNALLKTIEEPPEYAIIILLTTNADTFLQTILSRCVMLNIRPVKEDIIKNQLTSQYGVGDYEARVAATFSNGNPGKAIKLATSEEFKELKQYVVGMFMSLEKGGMDIIGEAIKKTGTFKKQIDEYFSLMRIWFRDILVYKATKEEDQIIFQDEYMTIEKMSQTYSFDDINDILKAESRIKSNVNFDSTIEILLLSIKEKTSGK